MCYKRPCWCLFKAFKGSIHSHSPLGGGVFAGYSDLLARGGVLLFGREPKNKSLFHTAEEEAVRRARPCRILGDGRQELLGFMRERMLLWEDNLSHNARWTNGKETVWPNLHYTGGDGGQGILCGLGRDLLCDSAGCVS